MKKSQMPYGRIYRPRHQDIYGTEKKPSWKKRIIFILVLIFLFGISYTLLFSPIFRIKNIKISGNQVLSNEEITNSLNDFIFRKFLIFFNKNNIFLATGNRLSEVLINDFPRIFSIEIKKNIFKKDINIKITERKEAGIFCRSECYYIDKEGVIFENAPRTSGTLILVINDKSSEKLVIGRSVVGKEFMETLINLRDFLLVQLNLKVLDFTIEAYPSQDLRVNTHEGWYALFDKSRDLKNQLDALKLVLEEKIKDKRQKLEYVDLRIENRAYYK